jgi:AraC family transcriptional regulator, exoenzyme S synthesis regulatory protein ExsA
MLIETYLASTKAQDAWLEFNKFFMKGNSESVLFSCVIKKAYSDEQIVPELTLLYLESGTIELQFAQNKYVANAGSITLIRKNELVKALKIPGENGQPCKSVNIFLTPETLKKYATQNKIELKHKLSDIFSFLNSV